jgi:SAM-dependent methyltransferase
VPHIASGVVPSPNIWNTPATYELENRAVDPDGVIEATMQSLRPWSGATILDIGCGTGYHLPRFALEAAQVVGAEPHAGLASITRRRTAGVSNITVLDCAAQRLPLPDASVDVAHARWAYFFGPGCEPGLTELERVMRRGGSAFVIDNDASRSTFGRWFRWALPSYDGAAADDFFARRGWQNLDLDILWRFERRTDLDAVVRIEFVPEVADRIVAEHQGLEVDYVVRLRVKHF